MENIFDVMLPISFELAEKAGENAAVIRVTKSGDDYLKSAGDHVIREDGITFFVGSKINADSWRALGGKIAGFLKRSSLPAAFLDCSDADDPAGLLEGLFLGAYEFNKYKAKKEETSCTLMLKTDKALFEEKKTVCAAVNMARQWGHEPASVINPVTLAERAEALAKQYGLKCRVITDEELREMGAGAIVAVGQGSKTPSRMIIVEYAGTKNEKPVVLVGKAITFDAGGYSLKTVEGIQGMKYDKCGAMNVLAILRAASELKLATPIIGIICAAENMISDKSYRPDDILTSLSGKTIEVKSTDAEGRLVLSDGLTFAQKNYEPRCIVDYATLTGGCVVALGHVRAGLMCPDEDLFNGLFAAGEKTWERVWRLPHDEDYSELIKSPDADIKNSGGRWGSPVTGGIFLKEFIEDGMPWAHMDIAGTADSDKASAYCVPGATGFSIRLTLEWLKGLE